MTSEVDATGLKQKVLNLLRLAPGAEIELSLLKNGSVLASKVNE